MRHRLDFRTGLAGSRLERLGGSMGEIVFVPDLTDREIAMLELIEFGIDRWSSEDGRELALGLEARGLIEIVSAPHEALQCAITAEGSDILESAKAFTGEPHNEDQDRPRRSRHLG